MSASGFNYRSNAVEATRSEIDSLGCQAQLRLSRTQEGFGQLVVRGVTNSLPYIYLRQDYMNAGLSLEQRHFGADCLTMECRDLISLLDSNGLTIDEHNYYQIQANPVFGEITTYIAHMRRNSMHTLHGVVETVNRYFQEDMREPKTIFQPRLSSDQKELLQSLIGRINAIAALIPDRNIVRHHLDSVLK